MEVPRASERVKTGKKRDGQEGKTEMKKKKLEVFKLLIDF